ncbi:MAG: polysaccharide deacetylase family protein, partial [Lachnospiraceae bacterium]|nr:polysaccharide deacetylase family protein [Lachnospiraceae bacterium]
NEDGAGEGTSDNTDGIKPQDNRTDADVQPGPAGEENKDADVQPGPAGEENGDADVQPEPAGEENGDTDAASEPDDKAGEESGEEIGGMEPDTDVPAIALTFDDGPFTSVTNRIVDVLLEYDASATFFVVGSRLEMYSDTLKRVYGSGFEVASHTWSHKNLNKLTEEEIIKEIGDTVDGLNKYITVENVLLRPPYGNADETVRNLAGTPLINWSLDSQDWRSRDAKKIIAHVLDTVQDGDIILMHDLYESTAEAVEYLVPELIKRGYRLVSVSELFRIKGIPLQEGILYRKPGDHY